jgi:hypothetical protein
MGNVVDRELYLYMITAENTMAYQHNFFILQDAIHNTVTIQTIKDTAHRTIYCTLHKDTIYTTLNTENGPVHLSCPPECRWLSVLLTGEQLVPTSKGLSHVLHVGHSWSQRGCETFFYERSFVVLVAKRALKYRVQPQCWRDRTARLVQNGNWYSRLAERVRGTKLYITGTNINAIYIQYCCGKTAWLNIVTGTMIIPGP